MKKMTKIALILAGIFIVIGGILVVLGLMMGARLEELEDMGIHVSPMGQTNTTPGIEFQIGEIDELDERKERGKETQDLFQSKEKEKRGAKTAGNLDRLEVEVENAKITIYALEDTEEIVYDSNRDIAERKEGSTLKLEDHSRQKEELELKIYLPVNGLKEIEIEALACELTADNIISDIVKLEIANAVVRVDKLTVAQQAQMEISNGEMTIGYFEGNSLEAECEQGIIKVACEGDSKDYNYELECGLGSITVGGENYSGMGEEIRVNNGSRKHISADCSMGEIILEFPGK